MTGERPSTPRIEPVDEVDDELAAILANALTLDGRPLNILGVLGKHPKLLKRFNLMGGFLLNKGVLPPREREIVILRVGWNARSQYEFGQHTIIGKACGLTDAEIAALTSDPGGPDNPSGPGGPGEHSGPGELGGRDNPSGPGGPGEHSGPGELGGPDNPSGPGGPSEHSGPGELGGPGEPAGPGEHGEHGERGGPGETDATAGFDWSLDDRALIALADELHADDCVSDATWAALASRWSEPELIELLLLAGFYRMVSGFLNSTGVELDNGVPGFPE